ncbi:RIP metalloprotease RseP [Wolbachia pipientis]|uniref:Zinc metalloprotease n=1 Tax=Wolbachia pipientis TaxID=955 RepID=A0A1E7QJY7_WOLPI|nr:RIP metalloprotease RseP [Wolbachia pipientis]OEY86778.1 RIP metalloprotease RseP [Wolbachia pipientis]
MELVASLIHKFGYALYYFLSFSLYYFLSFSLIISVVIFVHEFGHYIVAKLCKVKVESFSIGFGPEIFGFNDKSGTRWRLSIIPLGGYVKMLGDMNAASIPIDQQDLTDKEKLYAFSAKPRYKKAAIVFAGPFANILFSIIVFTVVSAVWGYYHIPPVVQNIVIDSPAEKAGLLPGDTITKVNGYKVKSFEDIRRIMVLHINRENVEIEYMRGNKKYKTIIAYLKVKNKDIAGNVVEVPTIGIVLMNPELKNPSFLESIDRAIKETYYTIYLSFRAIIQMITMERSIGEISGPIKIAQYSVQSVKKGVLVILNFMALISANLAIMNLLPIPLLDGGHLFQYIIEAIIRRDISLRYQKYAAILGASIILLLTVVTVWNDMKHFIST